jgi:hypothetical protein
MLTSEEAKQQFIVGGGVAFSVNALGSSNETLQLRAMQLMTKLAKLPAAKPALDAVQLGHKLTALKDHENVKKEGSQVVQAYRTLIIGERFFVGLSLVAHLLRRQRSRVFPLLVALPLLVQPSPRPTTRPTRRSTRFSPS